MGDQEGTPPIAGFGVAGYRTFQGEVRLDRLGRINVICGANNSGKSSLLSLLPWYPKAAQAVQIGLFVPTPEVSDSEKIRFFLAADISREWFGLKAVPSSPHFTFSRGSVDQAYDALVAIDGHRIWFSTVDRVPDLGPTSAALAESVARIRQESQQLAGIVAAVLGVHPSGSTDPLRTLELAGLLAVPTVKVIADVRRAADRPLSDDDLWTLAQASSSDTRGRRVQRWAGLLERILRDVFGDEVRYAVHPRPSSGDFRLSIDDQDDVPLDQVGAGVREVVAVAYQALTADGPTVLAIEEPENCLHPTAARNLIRSLADHTEAQIFVSTHSAGVVNSEPDRVIHVTRDGDRSTATAVTGDATRYAAVRALGYQPSDLVLTPCALWVEGPSDREYLRAWLRHHQVEDGVDVHIMFTGGALATHLTARAEALSDEILVAIRMLSRRCIIVADSDRSAEDEVVKPHVARLQEELADDLHGLCVVTWGREIENYLDPATVDAVRARRGLDPLEDRDGRWRRVIPSGESSLSKLDFARAALETDGAIPKAALDDVQRIADFIRRS